MAKIYRIFFTITVVSLVLLVIIIYNDRQFQDNPLSNEIKERLSNKNKQIKSKIKKIYGFNFHIPIIISDKLQNNLFGLTTYKSGQISILLNKNRFQENENYMIEYVLPHEYAHALMFHFKDFTKVNGGHSKKWQQICLSIDGKKCDRFVEDNDILIEKIGAIY